MGDGTLWLKAVHMMAVISWMAGLLYLPRLFVYHTEVDTGSPASETFKVMERRLIKAIMNPAAVITWGLGLALAWQGGFWLEGWFLVKAVMVVALSVTHLAMIGWKNDFAADRNARPQKFYRIANEIPTLLMIGIVIMVIVKPF